MHPGKDAGLHQQRCGSLPREVTAEESRLGALGGPQRGNIGAIALNCGREFCLHSVPGLGAPLQNDVAASRRRRLEIPSNAERQVQRLGISKHHYSMSPTGSAVSLELPAGCRQRNRCFWNGTGVWRV